MKKASGNVLVTILIIVLLGFGLFGAYYFLYGRNATAPTLPGPAPANVVQIKEGTPVPTVTPTPEADPLTEIQNLNVSPDDSDLKDLNTDLQGL